MRRISIAVSVAVALAGVASTVASVLASVAAFVRSVASRRTVDVPLCPLVARGRVGPDWARRNDLEAGPVPGEIEDFGVYDRPGFDADAIDPEVRRFYERTSEYDLAYETIWHRGFRSGAFLAAVLTGRLEQLNLPGRSDAGVRRLESRIARVPSAADPRGGVVWTRTDPDTGAAVFVAVYATHEREDVTYANVAVPLPGSNLSTVLRPERLETGAARSNGGAGVRFTTRGPGDGGLYLVTPLGAVRLPMNQSFRVWPADAPTAPPAPVDDAALVAAHEMWLCGQQFLTIRYGISRGDDGDDDRSPADG